MIANSAKAAGVLSEVPREVTENLYNYGRHLGLAFQIVDDILDFTSPTEILGKPAGSDLISGNITAPALYAMTENPYLEVLIEREFSEEGDIEKALSLVRESKGIQQSRELAAYHAQASVKYLNCLKPSASKQVLIDLADYVINRMY